MEYIGETGRQLKIRMKEHETDSKVDFRKKSGRKKKYKLSYFFRSSNILGAQSCAS